MLAHMLNGNLPDARHAHRRLAADTAAAGATALRDRAAALRVLRRLWPGDGGPATAAALSPSSSSSSQTPQQLHEQTAFAALESHAWPAGATAAVAAALAARLRHRAARDAAKCYSRLPLPLASVLLGYGADEAAALAAARAAGWRVVSAVAGTVLEPPLLSAAAGADEGEERDQGLSSGLPPQIDAAALRRLTEYVAHLEADGFGGLLAGGGGGGPSAAAAAGG
jgi:hypothetical protein